MSEPVRNRCRTSELTDDDVQAALERLERRDGGLAQEARHVYNTLTWEHGPEVIDQAGIQEWLWYRVPTKYLTDEPGYMARLAETAAALFDELGLHRYASICRSEETASVHAAFDRSDSEGFKAFRRARDRSGVDPPDLEDFAWGSVMRSDEAAARSIAEEALEAAIEQGRFSVGARGWRDIQREVTAEALDGDHPSLPGQSWRTAVLTERIEQWVSGAARRSDALGSMRAAVANRLLTPMPVPSEARTAVEPLVWLLECWGDEQPLTQAGYLKPAFVQSLQVDRPWEDQRPMRGGVRTEADDVVLALLREWLQRVGALRKQRSKLRRTRLGNQMAADRHLAWEMLTRHLTGDDWDGFVAQSAALKLLDRPGWVSRDEVAGFIVTVGTEMGWRSDTDGQLELPSTPEVSWSLSDALRVWEACGLIERRGEWRDRRERLTEVGESAVLAHLRCVAAGPKDTPL